MFYLFIAIIETCVLFNLLLVFHELGHVVAMSYYKIETEYIAIGWPSIIKVKIDNTPYHLGILPIFGFAYSRRLFQSDIPLNQAAVIALAGPVTSLVLGSIMLFIDSTKGSLFYNGGIVSLMIGFTNLIPLPPMDGWHIFRNLMHKNGLDIPKHYKKLLPVIGLVVVTIIAMILVELLKKYSST
jgi:membrane-associated protease RseP (regulator of RpoE activity)